MTMDNDIRSLISTLYRFVITRFPFWEAVTTALLLGEWGGRNRSHGIPDLVIYAHVAVAVVLGSVMSFDDRRRGKAALYAALQMMFVTIASYLIWSDSSQMVRLKIFSRNVAVLGAYLHFCSGSTHRRYVQLGNLSIGASLVSQAYLLYAWPYERSKLFRMIPPLASAEDPVTFLLCVLFCVCAFCFIAQTNMRTAARCALVQWSIMFLANLDYGYWTSYMEMWTQFRIIAADVCFMLTLATNYALHH